jgi:hypothetical protein
VELLLLFELPQAANTTVAATAASIPSRFMPFRSSC